MYPCFLTGVVLANYIDKITMHWITIALVSLLIFIISYLYLFDAEMFDMMPVIKSRLLNHDFTAFHDLLKVQRCRFITGISASLCLLSLFYGTLRHVGHGKIWLYIQKCGRTTLSIYILQTFLLEIMLASCLKFEDTADVIFDYILAPLISLLVLVVCVEISTLIEKNKTLSLLCLGKKIKS